MKTLMTEVIGSKDLATIFLVSGIGIMAKWRRDPLLTNRADRTALRGQDPPRERPHQPEVSHQSVPILRGVIGGSLGAVDPEGVESVRRAYIQVGSCRVEVGCMWPSCRGRQPPDPATNASGHVLRACGAVLLELVAGLRDIDMRHLLVRYYMADHGFGPVLRG
ncbi:hypothetical protein FDECE_13251 [Fusarium decemcellulare]|nr:hypothetical protein FDECE_13251 [Fusarium decemcellulare]